ncbi:MAG: hypothetical protein RL701_7855 [Pseudomonadota bacterium]
MKNSKPVDTATQPAQPERRKWLGSGTAVMASVVLGGIASALAACGDDDDVTNDGAGAGGGGGGKGGAGAAGAGKGGVGGSGTKADADIEPLNALLSAEYNAIKAYSAGAGLIGSAPSSDPLNSLKDIIVGIAVDIQSQHKLHAAALVDAIKALSGTPVVQSEVEAKFTAPDGLTSNPTITNVLKFAASAERGAAVAYNQVLAGLESAKLRFLAAAIEGDESQHFIVLTALVAGLAAPGDNLKMDRVGDIVPEAFVSTVGTQKGLDMSPPDYFG